MKERVAFISVAILAVVVTALITFLDRGASFADLMPSSAQQESTGISATVVPFTNIVQGTQSAIAVRANYVITSEDQFTELWKMIGATTTPPAIDFTKQAVLAVFAGEESSTKIAIARIEDSSERLVSITIVKPEDGCAAPKVSASPYEIVAVPATTLPLTHEDIAAVASCQK